MEKQFNLRPEFNKFQLNCGVSANVIVKGGDENPSIKINASRLFFSNYSIECSESNNNCCFTVRNNYIRRSGELPGVEININLIIQYL